MRSDSNFQRDRVQETCRTLRVLNAVRDPDIGIPLSIQQYMVFCNLYDFLDRESACQHLQLLINLFGLQLLTPMVLITRLINAHSHLLALRISEYLGMNKVSQRLFYFNLQPALSISIVNFLFIGVV